MNYRRVSPLSRFFLLLVFSVVLISIDHQSGLLHPVRAAASVINIAFESVIRLPGSIFSFLQSYYPDNSLHQRFIELQRNQAVLETRLQRYEALEKENQRLSQLLSASKNTSDRMLLAEIIKFGPEPFNHKIVINRGIEAGVYLGQPAIAPNGVLGQVSELGLHRSVVTLITDSSHGLAVQIQRNGLQTIIQGTGKSDQVRVPFLASKSDIRQGDLLVTSGIGGRFPVGYKVAEVTDIVEDASEAFLIITAHTTAKTGFVKEVLLLWNDHQSESFRPPHFSSADE